MGLPLPRVIPDKESGGIAVNALGRINDVADKYQQGRYNKVKADYAPTNLQAEAASKLAYANLMGPQFLAKLLQNPGAIANMGDDAAKAALLKSVQAGMGAGSGQNYLNNVPQTTGSGQPHTNAFSGYLKNLFGAFMGKGNQQSPNSLANPMPQQRMMAPEQVNNQMPQQRNEPGDNINHNLDAAWDDWMASPEGEAAVAAGDDQKIPTDQYVMDRFNQKNGIKDNGMKLELNTGNRAEKEKSYAQKEGEFKGTSKQAEKEGEYRAQARKAIGESQLALSNSGAALNKMARIIKNPVFQQMRDTIPAFQDKQLSLLKVTGTPEQKKLIGQFLSNAESVIATTVQGFSGKPLVREFDLAQRQKIVPSDTTQVAEGKLQNAIELHDIAERKNDIIDGLLAKGVNESDAVKQANKMVDVSAIEKRTEELLRDQPNEDDIKHMMKQYNLSKEEILKKLRAKGYRV